jgi:uncharacterized protein (DUF362 family)
MTTRRDLLVRGLGAAGYLACGFPGCATRTPAEPAGGTEPAPAPADGAPRPLPTAPVAIQRCESYEPRLVRERLDKVLDGIGGIGGLVRGKTVTVKLNLTGHIDDCCGKPAHRSYHTHPNVVAALCAALADAGAARILLAESFYYREPVEQVLKENGWDPAAIASAGAQKVAFVNTRNRGTHAAYARLRVAGGGRVYPAFDVHPAYEKTDVFVSLPKLKENQASGVTLSAKNLIGVLPLSLYGNDAPDEDALEHRGRVVHEGGAVLPDGVPAEKKWERPRGMQTWQYRVPRVVTDIVGARPIDLAVIEGVESIAGGEGPWNWGIRAVEPKLLLAGRNPVCTDAVAAAVMGYDPTAKHGESHFPGENHLRLLAEAGVGTNDPSRIDVRGLDIKAARFPFPE